VRLAQVLSDPRPEADLVAFGDERLHTYGDLRRRVARLAARLDAAGAGVWLLHCEDAYAFAVGLLAVAQAGATAWVTPNRQPGTLASVRRQVSGAILDVAEPATDLPVVLDPLAPEWVAGGTAPDLPPLQSEAPLLVLSTSGTTGEGKSVSKTLGHLGREVDVLEGRFGGRLGAGTRVFATASPQHLYGMLFRVLWPLAAGRPFAAGTWLHAGELLPRMQAAGDAALASTPAHLRRLPGLESVRDVCRVVWSSGAPLPEETADAIRAALGEPPTEIFGSTETGGVAWRRQQPGPRRHLWTPLAGVRVDQVVDGPSSGCLRVASPFVSAAFPGGESASFVMGDRVELHDDGTFLVLGRADRVVKIGEKRLSLPDMESRLREHPAVADAALVVLAPRGEARLGAVLVASESGCAPLDGAARRGLARELSEHLAPHWDRVLLPRAWRWLDALPLDAQGKTSASLLQAVFEGGPREPHLLSEVAGPNGRVVRFEVPADLAQLDGHFDGFPVVPGVAQLGWVMQALERQLGDEVGASSIEALKFREVLRPGQEFELRLECPRDEARARFELTAGDSVFASGRVRLREASERPNPASIGEPVVAAQGEDAGGGRPAAARVLPPVRELVPHAGPMLLIGEVERHRPEITVCRVDVARSRLFARPDGRVPAWVGLEYMAQCVAAHGGLVARGMGDALRPGLFLGSRTVHLSVDLFEPDEVLLVSARHLRGDLGLAAFACRVERPGAERPLLEGNLSVYVVARIEELATRSGGILG
jgi:acyl-coenzyme A synthetase/AMP-(fatty) acid ligase/predicted hotdog family 3-hydroxylacyl-ACP dehydratase/3-hydroxymyristoyl/3-hydroxydecanoyl-(acyl carrier protein) dehydratase